MSMDDSFIDIKMQMARYEKQVFKRKFEFK